MRVCLYQILEVPIEASAEEVKTAYRKKAVQAHPDKSSDPNAHKIFQEIQEAYSTLSNPTERAWYDKYRVTILGGKGSGTGLTAEFPSRVNIFPYFRMDSFEGYDASAEGFFNVYGCLFLALNLEELEDKFRKSQAKTYSAKPSKKKQGHLVAFEPGKLSRSFLEFPTEDFDFDALNLLKEGRTFDESELAPDFGDAQLPWSELKKFYTFWESFSTQRLFAFVDPYDITLADSRYERRKMEAENEKVRKKGRLDWNARVHRLVAFVRRRDPRAEAERLRVEAELKAKEEADLDKAARLALKAKLYKEHNRQLEESRWQEIEAELKAQASGGSESSSEEQVQEVLYCQPCKKYFKSLNSYVSHEKSAKHQKVMKALG